MVFILLVMVMLVIVGMFIESNAAYIMLVPLFAPIALAYGIDPLLFGFLFVLNLVIGMMTPPVGVLLFRHVRHHPDFDDRPGQERVAVHRPAVRGAGLVHGLPEHRDLAAEVSRVLRKSFSLDCDGPHEGAVPLLGRVQDCTVQSTSGPLGMMPVGLMVRWLT